jgi:hypothetical protein
MKKILSERKVQDYIISYLGRKGWARNIKRRDLHEHDVDIKIRHNKYSRYFLIETKGESGSKSAKSVSENSFICSLGQIITRMKTGESRYYYGIGLPESSARIAIRRLPWQLAKKLLLYVFSVDNAGKVRQYSWKELKQTNK